jgi:hypothetical protein
MFFLRFEWRMAQQEGSIQTRHHCVRSAVLLSSRATAARRASDFASAALALQLEVRRDPGPLAGF